MPMNDKPLESSNSSTPTKPKVRKTSKRGKSKHTTIRPNIPFSEPLCSTLIKHLGLGGMRLESVRDLVCSRLEQISDDDFIAIIKACGQRAMSEPQKPSAPEATPEATPEPQKLPTSDGASEPE